MSASSLISARSSELIFIESIILIISFFNNSLACPTFLDLSLRTIELIVLFISIFCLSKFIDFPAFSDLADNW